MTITFEIFPGSNLLMNRATNCEDRFYPARTANVINGQVRNDAAAAPRLTAAEQISPVTTRQPYSWWADSYQQGHTAVGGRYQFLRGAWLPQTPAAGLGASASWGACAPSTGEAC